MYLFLLLLILYICLAIVGVIVFKMQIHPRRYWQRAAEPLAPCAFQKSKNYLQVKSIHSRKHTFSTPVGYVSFSLFGNYGKYSPTLCENLKIAPSLLPGWKCRIYVGSDIPRELLQHFVDLNAEVYVMDGISKNFEGATWRFLLAQEDVVFVSRDADDVLNEQDAQNIWAWYRSGKRFFLANPYRIFLPMDAGKWGGRGKCVPDILEKLDKHCAFPFGFDEHFLRQEVYPLVQEAGYYEIPNNLRFNLALLAVLLTVIVIASLILAYQCDK